MSEQKREMFLSDFAVYNFSVAAVPGWGIYWRLEKEKKEAGGWKKKKPKAEKKTGNWGKTRS